jgi:hypothetical protein
MMLSIVIPVFDERPTIAEIIRRVRAVDVGLDKEIIVVDDGSTDGTREFLQGLTLPGIKVMLHDKNLGKGAALRTGFAQAGGTSSSSRTPTWSMTRGNTLGSSSRSSTAGPTWSTEAASWAVRTGFSFSGTMSGTGS